MEVMLCCSHLRIFLQRIIVTLLSFGIAPEDLVVMCSSVKK